MKRTMAAVIVGPTIRSPISVFASEHGRCGTTAEEDWLTTEVLEARMAELGHEVRATRVERGCFEVGSSDENDVPVGGVNPQTRVSLQSEFCCDERS